MKKLRWEPPSRPVPKHPYRDSAIAYAILSGVLLAIVAATDGSILRGVIAAACVFVVATGYSWWRWRVRLAQKERRGT